MYKACRFILLTGFLSINLHQLVIAAPWSGYGESKPAKMYSDDDAYEENYQFGVDGTYAGYRDPNINEALDDYKPFLNPNYAGYNLIIVINKSTNALFGRAQTMRVYLKNYRKNNGLIYYWLISTGIRGFETPSGFFIPKSFSSRHWSSQFDAPMLNSVFFSGGKALHTSIDSEALTKLGEAFSHGCVHIEDHRAKEIFHLIGHSGYGKVNKIDSKTGNILKDKEGKSLQVSNYKTLIIIH